jgi:hypothetical protein
VVSISNVWKRYLVIFWEAIRYQDMYCFSSVYTRPSSYKEKMEARFTKDAGKLGQAYPASLCTRPSEKAMK